MPEDVTFSADEAETLNAIVWNFRVFADELYDDQYAEQQPDGNWLINPAHEHVAIVPFSRWQPVQQKLFAFMTRGCGNA